MLRPICTTIAYLALFLISSCQTDRRVEGSQQAVEKMKSMQIKRVTNSQIISIVEEWGERIVTQTEKLIAHQANLPPKELCNFQKIATIDSLKKRYGAELQIWTSADMNSATLSSKEKELIDAYIYNAEHKIASTFNIQTMGDTVFIYTAPLSTNNLLSKYCLADKATPIAIWSVKFRKKEIIRKINLKSLGKRN